MNCTKVVATLMASLIAGSGMAGTPAHYYVDRNDAAASDANPGTELAPFKTIQAAVDVASAGDVVHVRPGVYDEGGREYTWTHDSTEYTSLDRVCIDKTLTLVATSTNPADTVIRGARDPNPPDGNVAGIGPNAVRCLRVVGSSTVDVIVKGFTLADGAAHEWGTTDNAAGYPGGFSSENTRCRAYFTDGVITNCSGARAGAIRTATAVRSLIVANTSRYGNDPGRAGRFFHCVFAKTGSKFKSCIFLNCTIAEAPASGALDADNLLFNTIIARPSQLGSAATANACRADHSLLPSAYNATMDADCSYADDMALVAPAAGDFRVRAGGVAATLGSAAIYPSAIAAFSYNAAVPDAVEIYKSMDGVTIDPESSAPIAAGAYQKTVETVGGPVVFARPLKVRGYVSQDAYSYAFATKAFEGIEAEPAGVTPIVYASRADYVGGTAFPDEDGVLRLGFPAAGAAATNTAVYAASVLYVDPDGVDDDSAGRGASDSRPYRTLQYAVGKLSGAGVIYAAEGTYQEGGDLLYGVTNRLAISSKNLRLVGKGAGKSFIYGRYDDESPTKSGDGRGAAAARCVAISGGNVAIQGFTLAQGYVGYDPEEPTRNNAAFIGGLVYSDCVSGGWNHQFAGCTLSGGVAYRAAAALGANFVRCHFNGTPGVSGGSVLRSVRLVSCLYTGSKLAGVDIGCSVYCSTLVEGVNLNANAPSSLNSVVNSIVIGTNGAGTYGDKYKGCVVWKAGSFNGSSPNTNAETDPVIVDAANGDYRVGSSSSAARLWYSGDSVVDNLSPYDFAGNVRRPISGLPFVGACAEPIQEVEISNDAAYVAFVVTGASLGRNFMEPGDTVAVEYAEGGRRRPIGFLVDGEEVLSDPLRYEYTVPAGGVESAAAITVEPLFSKDWYVNCDASVGDDGNSGFTPDAALRTLAATTNLAFIAGDVVHVAEGTYAEGDMPSKFSGDVRCRVTVPAGVKFVGDEGAEKTVVLGATDVRPAVVQATGELCGFTLTGGNLTSSWGGGFRGDLATGADAAEWAIVRDCIVTNNATQRGGAGYGGVAVGCRVAGNSGSASSGAFYQCRAYNTFVAPSVQNGSGQLCRYCYGFANCTFADFTGSLTDGFSSSGTVDNCIVLAKGSAAIAANHSIFITGRYTGVVTDSGDTCQWIGGDDDAKLVDGVPAKDSPAVDRGSVDLAMLSLAGEKDAFGGQRVYNNGAIDIGAAEYDWRGDYTRDLQGTGFRVTAAGAVVGETMDHAVLLPSSGELALGDWAVNSVVRSRSQMTVEVTGEGRLTLSTNGVACVQFTRADGLRSLKLRGFPASESDVATFTYQADVADADGLGARIIAFSASAPGAVLIVR